MKKSNLIIIVFMLFFSITSDSQINRNLLSENVFLHEILFDGICVEDIDGTNGIIADMQDLLGSNFTTNDDLDEYNNGIQRTFLYGNGVIIKSDGDTTFSLSSISVTNNSTTVTLQNTPITIGSSIDGLGNVATSTYKGESYVLYAIDSPVDISLTLDLSEDAISKVLLTYY